MNLSNSHGHLKSIVDRIEKLAEEKAAISADIKEVYAEAKATGFDVKTIRSLIRLRKKDPAERKEEQMLLDLYLSAVGMAEDVEEAAA